MHALLMGLALWRVRHRPVAGGWASSQRHSCYIRGQTLHASQPHLHARARPPSLPCLLAADASCHHHAVPIACWSLRRLLPFEFKYEQWYRNGPLPMRPLGPAGQPPGPPDAPAPTANARRALPPGLTARSPCTPGRARLWEKCIMQRSRRPGTGCPACRSAARHCCGGHKLRRRALGRINWRPEHRKR